MRTLSVDITLTAPVFDAMLADADGEPARRRTGDELTALVGELGVAARPEVRLLSTTDPVRAQPVRVSVDGRHCPVPSWVLCEAVAYATGSVAVSTKATAEELLGIRSRTDLYEALALVARAAVTAQPEVLVPPGDPLATVLRLGMSLAAPSRPPTPVEAMRDALRSGGAEELLVALAAPAVELFVEPEYLRALTTDRPGGELFPYMRDGLFVELGVVFPEMRMHPDPTLRPRGFAFRVNAVRTVPRIGLAVDTIYVNDTASRLATIAVDEAVPSANPATHQPGAIVRADHRDALEATGLTTWDPFGYYILALAAVIRTHAAALMTRALGQTIQTLGRAFPAVTMSIDHLGVDAALRPLLRSLLSEQISIRNLRHILQLVVRHTVAPELTDGLDLARFVRAGLAEQIGYAAAHGTGTVVVYLLDPAFERELADREARAVEVEPALAEELRTAVHAEMQYLPETAQVPSLLTGQWCRATVREVLRTEFPIVRVLCYSDIPGHYNIQPVARIARP